MSPAHSCLPHVQHLSTRVVGPKVLGKSPNQTRTLQILLSCSPKTDMEKVSESSICTSKFIQVRSRFIFPVSSPSSSSAHSRSTTRRAAWGMTWFPETKESIGGKPPGKHRIFNPSLHHSSTQLHIPTSNKHHIHQELDHGKSCHYFPNQDFALPKIGGACFKPFIRR